MIIYKTVNQDTGKWYIGKDAKNRAHYLGSGLALRHAVKKYGKQSFIKTILEQCDTLTDLSVREKHWISVTNAVADPMSYNLADGGEGGDLSKFIDYAAVDRTNYKMTAATEWFHSLSDQEKKDFHSGQAEKRCKGWYVSRVDDTTEVYVRNISKWCRENSVGPDIVSNLTNPEHALFQKQTNGWRFRKEGQSSLSPYINKRKIGHPNVACSGRSWKIVDGHRVWSTATKENA